jgi:NitT/TauT family transport system ATP-binding protein
MSSADSVRLDHVSIRFGAVEAVAAVDLTLPAGSFTAFVGPSGCGKTTLLRAIGGLVTPAAGRVSRPAGAASFCFQEPRLLPWRNLRDNVALPLELGGIAPAERLERAAAALQLVQLAEAAERRPHELSGGMKMRAALARALVAEPALLLLDEPFGALDEVTRQELDAALRELWRRRRFTAVLVTHSLPEAVFVAERVVVFSPRPARLVANLATPVADRTRDTWTETAHNAVVRAASEALYGAVAEARR